jgi:hypothetical protein
LARQQQVVGATELLAQIERELHRIQIFVSHNH